MDAPNASRSRLSGARMGRGIGLHQLAHVDLGISLGGGQRGMPQQFLHTAQIAAALDGARVELVCLAGYMRLLSPAFLAAFPGAILNIHPSLLPAFPGLDAQRQALAYGVAITGCTVHFVDEELDHGPIVLQRTVPVLNGDDEASLSARILEQEHIAYPEAIARVVSGKYAIVGRRYVPRAEDMP